MTPLATIEAWRREEAALGVPAEDRSFYCTASSAKRPVLLLHGAGGRPGDFQTFAKDLARHGFPSFCPRLPGHGLGDEALGALRFETLAAHSRESFDLLAGASGPPAILGQSLGAVLGIRLALERPAPQLAALAPALRPFVVRRVGRVVRLAITQPRAAFRTWRWQTDVRRGIVDVSGRLGELQCPLLVFHSEDDDSVSVEGARELVRRAGSASKRLVLLHGQGHVLSIAPQRERIVAELAEFLGGAAGE